MDFPLAPVGEGLIEVELLQLLVRPGDAVARGQSLAEVMSDKANMEVPSPFAGTISALGAQPGTNVKVGERFLSYKPAAGSPREDSAASPLKQTVAASAPSVSPTAAVAVLAPPKHTNGHGPLSPAAPSVGQLARKLGVDLSQVRGSGPHGRILIDDVTPLIAAKRADAKLAPAAHATDTYKLDFGVAGTRMKLTGTRRKIAEHLVASKRAIPHYSHVDECNISDLVKLRGTLRDPLAQAGVKLTYLAFFVKAVARALREVPVCNSTYDEPASDRAPRRKLPCCRTAGVSRWVAWKNPAGLRRRSTTRQFFPRMRMRSCCTTGTTSASRWPRRTASSCRWSVTPTGRTWCRCPADLRRNRDVTPVAGEDQFRRLKRYQIDCVAHRWSFVWRGGLGAFAL